LPQPSFFRQIIAVSAVIYQEGIADKHLLYRTRSGCIYNGLYPLDQVQACPVPVFLHQQL